MFKHPFKIGFISTVIMAAGLVLMIVGSFIQNNYAQNIGIAVIVTGMVFRFIFYRCPQCKHYLGNGFVKKCRVCGYEIKD